MEDLNLSRNASSSRAIPVERLIADVIADPAEPLYWGANKPGMQAGEELTGMSLHEAKCIWRLAMANAAGSARNLATCGAHKQIVNRLLEPFSHITVVVTATAWSNFFALRDHPDAEPHIRMLAQAVRKARDEATVQTLKPGEWHLPFVDLGCYAKDIRGDGEFVDPYIKLSVARCASTSYKTVEGFDMTMERALALHDKLRAANPMHASPFEHQCRSRQP